MTVKMITSNSFDVTSEDDAQLYAAIVGRGAYALGSPLDINMTDANTLVVGSGVLLMNGRYVQLDGNTTFTIPSGVQGQKRSNLAVIRCTISRDESTLETTYSAEPKVVSGEAVLTGTPVDPTLMTGNLLDGDTIVDFPIARVITDGINAETPVPLYTVQVSASALITTQRIADNAITLAKLDQSVRDSISLITTNYIESIKYKAYGNADWSLIVFSEIITLTNGIVIEKYTRSNGVINVYFKNGDQTAEFTFHAS